MSTALWIVAYLAVGTFAAAFYRKRFGYDVADGPIEVTIAALWPLAIPAMVGSIVGDLAKKRK
jgi:hypothetical protein